MGICNIFSGGMEGQKIGRNCLGQHMHVDAFRPRCHFLLGRRQLCDQRLTTRPRCTRELRAQDEVGSVCIMYVLLRRRSEADKTNKAPLNWPLSWASQS